MAMLEVRVDGLALDMTTNSPVVILAPLHINKVLPIWIGHSEAWAIAMELSGIGSKRPMTHDLLKMVIGVLSAEVEKVEITELKEQTFYARVLLKSDGKTLAIDARPSDSIALALKAGAPIFVEEALFNLKEGEQQTELSNDPESLADRLKKINPEDFGKYSL
ncbi:MAG: bifunctional nuclease family protein [candidate division Zixibacteria bacterium]|nr:bifunctional nuclease family protein [candidate division Zixibacteria bacterium]